MSTRALIAGVAALLLAGHYGTFRRLRPFKSQRPGCARRPLSNKCTLPLIDEETL
jgi:hypothetical protein